MKFDGCKFLFCVGSEEGQVHIPTDCDVEDVLRWVCEVVDTQGCAEHFGVFGLES